MPRAGIWGVCRSGSSNGLWMRRGTMSMIGFSPACFAAIGLITCCQGDAVRASCLHGLPDAFPAKANPRQTAIPGPGLRVPCPTDGFAPEPETARVHRRKKGIGPRTDPFLVRIQPAIRLRRHHGVIAREIHWSRSRSIFAMVSSRSRLSTAMRSSLSCWTSASL